MSHDYISLTTGYLPDRQNVERSQPRWPELFPNPSDTDCLEKLLAWTLAASCRQLLRRYCSAQLALKVPLEVWIVGAPKSARGRFASWFSKVHSQDYRIFLHRTALTYRDTCIHAVWREGTHWKRFRPVISRQHLQADQFLTARPFLRELMERYASGRDEVISLFEQTEHLYWYSEGQRAKS